MAPQIPNGLPPGSSPICSSSPFHKPLPAPHTLARAPSSAHHVPLPAAVHLAGPFSGSILQVSSDHVLGCGCASLASHHSLSRNLASFLCFSYNAKMILMTFCLSYQKVKPMRRGPCLSCLHTLSPARRATGRMAVAR